MSSLGLKQVAAFPSCCSVWVTANWSQHLGCDAACHHLYLIYHIILYSLSFIFLYICISYSYIMICCIFHYIIYASPFELLLIEVNTLVATLLITLRLSSSPELTLLYSISLSWYMFELLLVIILYYTIVIILHHFWIKSLFYINTSLLIISALCYSVYLAIHLFQDKIDLCFRLR